MITFSQDSLHMTVWNVDLQIAKKMAQYLVEPMIIDKPTDKFL